MSFESALKLALVGIAAAWLVACASDPPPAEAENASAGTAANSTDAASAQDDSWWPSFGVPKVHKIVVQQGNVITQQMVDRLKPGMTKAQVQFVLGRPVLEDLFDPNRWVYVYIYQVPDYPEVRQNLTLYFENDKLARFAGDIAPSVAKPAENSTAAAPTSEPPSAAAPVAAPDGAANPATTPAS